MFWRLLTIAAALALTSTLIPPAATAARRATSKPTSTRVPADFNVVVVDDVANVTAGDTAVLYVDVKPSSTFRGSVVFDLPNLTDRFAGRLIAESGSRVRLEVNVPPFASTNSGVFILRGRGGAFSRQALFRLNVTARPVPVTTAPPPTVPAAVAPQFTLRPSVLTVTATPGNTVTYGVSVDRSAGFSGPVSLRVDGLPTGTTWNFSPNPTTAGSVLYVTPSAVTPSGTYVLSVVGQAEATIRATAVNLVVSRTGDFTLLLQPQVVTVPPGNDAVGAVNIVARPGFAFSPDVTLTSSGGPSGAVVFFDPNPTNGVSTVRVRTLPRTRAGTYRLTVIGRSAGFTRTAQMSIVVLGDTKVVGGFGISATPTAMTVAPGVEAGYTVAIVPNGGFNSAIDFAVRGLPPFAVATTTQNGLSAAVRITTSPATPTGVFPLQITATSGSLSASVVVNLGIA